MPSKRRVWDGGRVAVVAVVVVVVWEEEERCYALLFARRTSRSAADKYLS